MFSSSLGFLNVERDPVTASPPRSPKSPRARSFSKPPQPDFDSPQRYPRRSQSIPPHYRDDVDDGYRGSGARGGRISSRGRGGSSFLRRVPNGEILVLVLDFGTPCLSNFRKKMDAKNIASQAQYLVDPHICHLHTAHFSMVKFFLGNVFLLF